MSSPIDAQTVIPGPESPSTPARPNLETKPEDSFRVLRRELAFARTMTRPIRGTIGLLIAIAVIFFVGVVTSEILTGRFGMDIPYELVIVLGAKNNRTISDGALWRLGSHMMLHGNSLHLLINGYALFVLGNVLEKLYGLRRFLLLYFISGFCGGVASYLLTPGNSVGASGAIFGLLGAAVVFGVKFRGLLPQRVRRLLTAGLLPWVALNVVIGLTVPGIDNAAHMGGLFGGALVGLFLGTALTSPGTRVIRGAQWALVALTGGFVLFSVAYLLSWGVECADSARVFFDVCLESLRPE